MSGTTMIAQVFMSLRVRPPPKKKTTFYYFLIKTYVAGTKKNRLNETIC